MNKKRGSRGFTLVELLAGISLSLMAAFLAYSLFVDLQGQILKRRVKTESAHRLEITGQTIKKILMESRQILEVEEERIRVQKASGGASMFAVEDGNLRQDELVLLNGVEEFKISVTGPVLFGWDDDLESLPASRSRLLNRDRGRDGILDFDDLDLDGSGVLEKNECGYIGLIEVKISMAAGKEKFVHSFKVHTRN